MNAITSTTGIPMSVVCVAVPIFVVLFVAILMVLRQSSMFDKPTAVVLAFCVAVLCLIGMFRVVVVPTSGVVVDAANDSRPLLNTILLPYAAMALALLLTLLYMLIAKVLGGRERILDRWKDDLAPLRRPSGREALQAAPGGLPKSVEKGKFGPPECADRLKKM
jgi:hypothetical protein